MAAKKRVKRKTRQQVLEDQLLSQVHVPRFGVRVIDNNLPKKGQDEGGEYFDIVLEARFDSRRDISVLTAAEAIARTIAFMRPAPESGTIIIGLRVKR